MTELNKKVWDFMHSYQKKNFEPPSLNIIAKEFGWESHNSAFKHIRMLLKEDKIKQLRSGRYAAI